MSFGKFSEINIFNIHKIRSISHNFCILKQNYIYIYIHFVKYQLFLCSTLYWDL